MCREQREQNKKYKKADLTCVEFERMILAIILLP